MATELDNLSLPRICLICSDATLGIHFGIDACRACSAFFRRSVAENKEYVCRNKGKCVIRKDVRNLCRKCRLIKCLELGMKKENVQPKRDPIAQKSLAVDPNPLCAVAPLSENEAFPTPSTSTELVYNDIPNYHPSFLLSKILANYRHLREIRRHTELSLDPTISKNKIPLGPLEGLALGTAGQMSNFFRAHVHAVTDFLANSFEEFALLEADERWILLRPFLVNFWWFDCGFMTLRKIPKEHFHKIFIQSETTYMEFDRCDEWVKDIVDTPEFQDGLSGLTKKTMQIENIKSMYKMEEMKLWDEEAMAIIGLMFWNTTVENQNTKMMLLIRTMRSAIFEELNEFYRKNSVLLPATRLGELLDLYNMAMMEMMRCCETMEFFTVLDALKEDNIFYEMVKWCK